MPSLRLLSLISILITVTFASTFPCADYGSDVYGEINCLRRLLNQCSTDKQNRETRTVHPVLNSGRQSTPRPATTTSASPAPTWVDTVTESVESWPTPNSALIIDALKFELTREIELKIREANDKFDGKMASYQVQMETELKKLNKELRMLKLKVHRRGRHEYILSEDRESWYTAGEMCTQWGGHLVSVRDAAENQFVAALLSSHDSAWIGLNDVQREDQWENADGEKTTYRKWETNQPDNLYHNENCVEVMGDGGKWRDSLCLLTKRFVCRRS